MAQPGFIFGGNTGMSYDQVQKQRDIANELLRANMSTPQNVGEGLSAIGRALAAKAIDKRASRADEANRKAFEATKTDTFAMLGGFGGAPAGGMGSGYSGGTAAPVTGPTPITFTPETPNPGGLDPSIIGAVDRVAPNAPQQMDAGAIGSRLVQDLSRDFNLTPAQAAGVAGNLAHETGGFKHMQEIQPMIPGSRGGYGFAQWTGPRRKAFEAWTAENGLDPNSYEANYGFLAHELKNTPEGAVLGPLSQAQTPDQAAEVFSNQFLRPGIPNIGSRVAFANQFAQGAQGAAPQPAAGGSPGMPNPAVLMQLAEIQGNPYASESDKAIASLLMNQTVQAMDPMRQMEMQKAQLELQQMQQPQAGFQMLTDEQEAQMGLNPAGVYQQGPDGALKVVQDAPKEASQPSSVQEYQFAQSQGYEGSFQQFQADLKKAGASNTTVTVGGDAAPPSDEPLRKKLMEGEGTTWNNYLTAGTTASGMKQDMQLLDQVIELAPTGPVTGRLAEMFPGVSDAAGVFQSVVKRVAPSLRVEGSGSQSDIEYNGFLQSLPALSNRPEANRAIASFLKGKAQVNMDRAAAVSAYQNGEIDAVTARNKIAEIDGRSIMSPEIESLLGALDQGGTASAAGPAPEGVDQEVWDVMTDEERALFQ